MTGEQSVLVFGVICVALFVFMLSRGGKKKNPEAKFDAVRGSVAKASTSGSPRARPKNRAHRRLR